MKKVYEFWGMQRSGNHAILNWQLENFCNGLPRKYIFDYACFYNDEVLFLNAVGWNNRNRIILNEKLKESLKLKVNTVVLSYEDCDFDKSLVLHCKKFIIMRNLENLVASRMRGVDQEWPIDDNFFEMWETYARSNISKIHYDKWLIDKPYRDSIAQMFNTDNKDITNTMSVAGAGSSFIGMKLDKPENLLTRYQQIDIPPDIKKKIIYYGERNPEFCNVEYLKNFWFNQNSI
jgi:hypothetical protein